MRWWTRQTGWLYGGGVPKVALIPNPYPGTDLPNYPCTTPTSHSRYAQGGKGAGNPVAVLVFVTCIWLDTTALSPLRHWNGGDIER